MGRVKPGRNGGKPGQPFQGEGSAIVHSSPAENRARAKIQAQDPGDGRMMRIIIGRNPLLAGRPCRGHDVGSISRIGSQVKRGAGASPPAAAWARPQRIRAAVSARACALHTAARAFRRSPAGAETARTVRRPRRSAPRSELNPLWAGCVLTRLGQRRAWRNGSTPSKTGCNPTRTAGCHAAEAAGFLRAALGAAPLRFCPRPMVLASSDRLAA